MTKTVKKRLQAVVALLVTMMIMIGIMPNEPFNTYVNAVAYRVWLDVTSSAGSTWGATHPLSKVPWIKYNGNWAEMTPNTSDILGDGNTSWYYYESSSSSSSNIVISWNSTDTASEAFSNGARYYINEANSSESTPHLAHVNGYDTTVGGSTDPIDHSEVIGRGMMDATFYNYYYDQQVESNAPDTMTITQGQYKRPFAYFNTAVMHSGYGTNGNIKNADNSLKTPTYDANGKLDYYPTLYAGEFWNDPGGYTDSSAAVTMKAGKSTRENSNYSGSYYNGTTSDNGTVINQNLNNFVWSANLADRLDDNYNHVSQMMIDKTISLDPSSSTYMVPTAGGYKLPYFDSDFLYGNNVFGKNLGKVYSVKYPFYQRQLSGAYTPVSGFSTIAAGTKMYTLDSDKDSVKVTSSGITENSSFVYDGNAATGGSRLKGFFPMNNPGDTEDQLQFGFGTRFDIPFTIGKNGEDADGKSMIFTFTGDDDVWVFIDGELVLDMGGGHKKATGAIDFSKSRDNVAVNGAILKPTNTIATASYNTTGALITTSSKVAEILAEANAAANKVSNEHMLTMYYMERGKINSNMSLAFNFVTPSITPVTEFEPSMPTTETFKVREVTDFSGINPGLVSYTKLAAENDVFSYVIQRTGAAVDHTSKKGVLWPTYDEFTRSNGDISSLDKYGSDDGDIANDTQLTGAALPAYTSTYYNLSDKYIYVIPKSDWGNFKSIAAWVWQEGGNPTNSYCVVGEKVNDNLYRFDFTCNGDTTVTGRNKAQFYTSTTANKYSYGSVWADAHLSDEDKHGTADVQVGQTVNCNTSYTVSDDYTNGVLKRQTYDSEALNGMKSVSYIWRDGNATKTVAKTDDTNMAFITTEVNGVSAGGQFGLMYGTDLNESSAEFVNQITPGATVIVEQKLGLNTVNATRSNGNSYAQTPFTSSTRNMSNYYNTPAVSAYNTATMGAVSVTAGTGSDSSPTGTLIYGASGDTNFGITETWVNTPQDYDIRITKNLLDNSTGQNVAYGSDNQEFTVQITLTNVFGVMGNDVSGYTAITKTSSDSARNGNLQGASTTGTFTIKAGETVTIPDVPYGTVYSIQELPNGVNTSVYTTLDTAVKSGTVTGTTAITISNAKGTAANDQFTLTVAKKWSLLDKDALTDAGITSVKYQLQRTISAVTDAASYAAASWEDVGSVFTVGTSDTVTGDNTTNVTWSKSLGTYDVKDSGGNVYTYRIIEYAQDDTALIYKNEGWYNGECQALYTFEESNTTKNNYALAMKNATTELAIKNQYRSISSGQPLPKTGARGVYAIVTFGAFAITIAGVALLIYRKKLQTVNIYAVKGSEKPKE